jgi:hypothetical protein
VWPAVYLPEDLEWEDDNWCTGQISASEIEGYPISLMHDCGSNIQARYWRLQITDESNADGYIELARLWMGPLWSPQINYDFGVQFGWEPRSVSEYSLGGVRFTEPRPSARVLKLTLNSLSDAEAYGTILDAQRRLGTAAELVVIPDPADTARAIKRNFLAGFRAFDPLTQAFLDAHSASFEMEERL